MKLLRLFFAILITISGIAHAEQVVTFVDGPRPTSDKKKPYLVDSTRDQGYVSVTAGLNNPPNATCVAPAENTFFADRKLDVIITGQIFGFFGIDSSKEIPIATYEWTGSRYCRSAFIAPILLVPPTPIAVHEIGGATVTVPDPYVVIRLRSSSSTTEKMSTHANALLAIGSTLTTGGAANTVVGLSKISAGPAVKWLSDGFNAQLRGKADQTIEVGLPWKNIEDGVQPVQVQLVSKQVETTSYLPYRRETIKEATDALHTRRVAGQLLATLDFKIHISRSQFSSDNALNANNVPNIASIRRYAVLNYPRRFVPGEFESPTIYQRINTQAPSLFKTTKATQSEECDRLLVTLRDLGFNAIDRAVVVGAVLDEDVAGWRANGKFRQLCLHTEPDIEKLLTAMDPAYFPTPPIGGFIQPEIATNPPADWVDKYSKYMSNLRLALYSKEAQRAKVLKSLLGNSLGAVDGNIDSSLNAGAALGAFDLKSDDFLKDLIVSKAGCIFGFTDTTNNELHSAMLFSAQDKEQKNRPYLFIVQHGAAAGEETLFAKNLWIYSMDNSTGQAFSGTLEGARFGKGSICYRGENYWSPTRTLDEVLNGFRI